MARSRPLFVYFRPFVITISVIQIEKSIDGTQDGAMAAALVLHHFAREIFLIRSALGRRLSPLLQRIKDHFF